MTDNTINNLFVSALFTKTTGKTITAYFKNGTSGSFSAYMFNDLKSDNATECITDNDTGEVLFINE